jgi:hypothetical protein
MKKRLLERFQAGWAPPGGSENAAKQESAAEIGSRGQNGKVCWSAKPQLAHDITPARGPKTVLKEWFT